MVAVLKLAFSASSRRPPYVLVGEVYQISYEMPPHPSPETGKSHEPAALDIMPMSVVVLLIMQIPPGYASHSAL